MLALLSLPLLVPGFHDLPLAGLVARPAGTPVAGARVLLLESAEWPFDPPGILVEAVSDRAGRFELSLPARWLGTPGYKPVQALILGPQGGLSAVNAALEELPIGADWRLVLPRTEPWTLTVTDADGAPAAGVEVVPGAIGDETNMQLATIPDALRPQLAARTDERGQARITRWSRAQAGVVELTLPDGTRERRWPSESFAAGWLGERLALAARSALELCLADGADPALAGQALVVRGFGRSTGDGPVIGHEVKTPATLPAPGATTTVMAHAGAVLFEAETPRFELGVKPEGEQESRRWVVSDEPHAPVVGRVVDAESGAGIPGVRLRVFSFPVRALVETDAQGYYRFSAKRSVIGIEQVLPPPPYARLDHPPQLRGLVIGAETERLEAPTLALPGSQRRAEGTVTGADGAPVAGALVRCEVSVPMERFTTTVHSYGVTDAAGHFSLTVPAGNRATLTARHAGATTPEGVTFGEGPVEIRLSRLVGLRGVLTVDGAPPGDGLRLEVWSASPEQMIGGERRLSLVGAEAVAIAADGGFEVAPSLEPDKRFCLVVRGPTVEITRSAYRSGREWAREPVALDLRALTVARGRALGPDGQPLSGARVFARGDAQAALETTTGEDGSFELDGLVGGGGLVFVDGGAHGLRAMHAGAGRPVEVRFGGERAPLAPLPPAARALELGVARELLVDALEREEDDYARLRYLEQLAHVDPAEAIARLETSGLDDFRSNMVRRAMMRGLLDGGFDEAVALVESMTDPGFASRALVELARELPPEQEERRVELCGLALANARAVQAPEHRLVDLSHVGEALLDFGRVEEARELLVGAIPLADSLAHEEWAGYARAAFAEELAHFDLEIARRLVGEIKGGDPERHLGNIAHELAAVNPAAAQELIDGMPTNGAFRPERFAPRVCHDMAPVDLERALAIAERHDPHGYSHGMIARALAESDPVGARRVLEEAFQRLAEASDSKQRVPAYFSGVAAAGAALLPVAELVAPGELDHYLARVLALRKARPDFQHMLELQHSVIRDASVAFYVARYDRALARRLLERGAEFLAGLETGPIDSDWASFFAAAAVVDPQWAAELARAHPGLSERAVAATLARQGEERRRYVQDEYHHLWIVGKEDL